MRHIHLDALGGMAGDMFAAALLHAFPEYEAEAVRAASRLSGVPCALRSYSDGVLSGARFVVAEACGAPHAHGDHDHHHDHDHDHDHHHHGAGAQGAAHGHVPWRAIRARLQAGGLAPAVLNHATGIFAVLAEAEGRVHGLPPEEVTFHEVGAADSVADIVAAAVLIAALGDEAGWSVGPLPLGGGFVATAHGRMPVPAPATALLLDGFETVDDGVGGERVTPTGAAILRHLGCAPRAGLRGRLGRSGVGFGARRLAGMPNVLRVLEFTAGAADGPSAPHRSLAVIAFEVDDQSGEDLACGLERLRAVPGVHDVLQAGVIGKKGRMAAHVQVLVRPDALEDAVGACFRETTTIGLRTHLVEGRALPRTLTRVEVQGRPVRVKTVIRPDGTRTGKAEADDALCLEGHAARARLRREAENAAAEEARADA